MGYAVLHLEKAKGNDSKISEHIERKYHPKNADETKTHLNRELVQFPDGVHNRTEAIAERIKQAGIKRKIADNQVRAIRILLTASPEDMKRIVAEDRLDEWCEDNLKWLKKTYGADNVVSAVLHMDEQTPHLHATIVPIVTGERRKAKQEQPDGKKKYRKKNPLATRLCADDVMTQKNLKSFQDSYADAMSKYGLQRGVEGSEARHISTMQYYKGLVEQQDGLQENIDFLRKQEKEAQKTLKQAKGEINTQKMKKAVVDSVSSLLNGSKVQRLETENEYLKQNNTELQTQVETKQTELRTMAEQYQRELDKVYQTHQLKTVQYNERWKRIDTFFPYVKTLLGIINQCTEIGLAEEVTKQLLKFKPVVVNGSLYSKIHNRKFKTERSTAIVAKNPQQNNRLGLFLDGLPAVEWFKRKYQEYTTGKKIRANL